ncbi:tyrosine decarboxylase [Clostridium cavendishii DSM 21758]|uniref:Tyrosine decarboxylase n=1 Tax=Clostridium cavendishii DSM 21758 TaxID=1121302 RepID=A0A1M6R9M1_9CLOT|nr:tyrosine decarboxylase [Clostridium cavendishii]SHK29175.1 tyrosine decarboxylase [Clostridium cavendishii DSM 21758]
MDKNMDLKALFLGPKSENKDIFEQNLKMLFEDHSQWRKNYHPEDDTIIKPNDRSSENFIATRNRMEQVLTELSSKLRAGSVPWHSPRFQGHMNSETLVPAILGYFAATLYNGNNVAYESSPATSEMEEEVGADFCKLMSYKAGESWGHICADGSIANLEGMWYARNLASLPLAVKEIAPELVEGKTEWELLNMSVDQILDLADKIPEKLDELKAKSARAGADKISKVGKWLVPQTKHYSWLKAADILGIGLDNVIAVEVGDNYRMSMDALRKTIDELTAKQIPVLGVVGVVGSTEEGAVDDLHKILEVKAEYAAKGINFYFHVDAAYGGYARAIFLDEEYNFIPQEELHAKYLEYGVFQNAETQWPSTDTYEAFKAMSQADTITIDPHKMGYIPYSAGGIVIRDKRMRDYISYFATYVFEQGMDIPALLGAFILEGSKAGATAASVWTAHRALPLNITGYGKLMGASVEGSYNLYTRFRDHGRYVIGDKVVILHPLVRPDFNMVDFVFNYEGNTDLAVMNDLNHQFYEEASYVRNGLYSNDFITSHTDFAVEDYGHSPLNFVLSCGPDKEQWLKEQKVTILRACVLSPYLNNKEVFAEYMGKIDAAITKKLENIILK